MAQSGACTNKMEGSETSAKIRNAQVLDKTKLLSEKARIYDINGIHYGMFISHNDDLNHKKLASCYPLRTGQKRQKTPFKG